MQLIYMEERIMCFLKNLEVEVETLEEKKKKLNPSGSKPGIVIVLAKIHKTFASFIFNRYT